MDGGPIRLAMALVLVVLLPTNVVAIHFDELARINLQSITDPANPSFIGSKANSVAWNGSELYIGGINSTEMPAPVGVAEVGGSFLGFIDSPQVSLISAYPETEPGFGVTGIDLHPQSDLIAIAYESGLESTTRGISVINNSVESTELWSLDVPGIAGVAMDPGYQGVGFGTSFPVESEVRLPRFDTLTGEVLLETKDGMRWGNDGANGRLQDVAFSRLTGNSFVRHDGYISRGVRIGPSETVPSGIVAGSYSQADHLNVESFLAFSVDVLFEAILYNEPTNLSSKWDDSIRLTDGRGVLDESLQFRFLNGQAPESDSGAFDFSFDHDSQQLAILDIANQTVHVFSYLQRLFPDADRNGTLDCADIDRLTLEVATGRNDIAFDGNGDGEVNREDLALWRLVAAEFVGHETAFLQSDINLDRVVDVSDFNIWNANRFEHTAAYCSGDINADGVTDVNDFALWNAQRFRSSDDAVVVPEPAGTAMVLVWLGIVAISGLHSRARRA